MGLKPYEILHETKIVLNFTWDGNFGFMWHFCPKVYMGMDGTISIPWILPMTKFLIELHGVKILV